MKHKIDIVQIYITHVCNLTCEHCESFNNRKFKGHFYWEEFAEDYKRWSQLIDIHELGIIGGEPFAHPELLTWVTELRKLWPDSPIAEVWTNGSMIKNNIELSKEIIRQRFQLRVNVHDPAHWNETQHYLDEVMSTFSARAEKSNNEINYFLGDTQIGKIYPTYNFYTAATKVIRDGVTYMHDSDPAKAHEVCGDECNYLLDGRLYRCALTAISKDLIDQFKIEQRAADLLKEYKNCSPWDTEEDIAKFIDDLHNPCPQCRLCPEKHVIKSIWPLSPKKQDL